MSFRTYNGYAWSENGWRICNADETVVITVAGMNLRVRSGPAAQAMQAWVTWYHENVEPIDRYKPIDDWGWSATNDVNNSNHLSGTAVDLNATQYPWGSRVMPAARIAKVREGLKLFEGIIFWGADWSRADEMHYQLNGGTASGEYASPKLTDFVARRVKNGRLTTNGGSFMAGISDAEQRELLELARQLKPFGTRKVAGEFNPDGTNWAGQAIHKVALELGQKYASRSKYRDSDVVIDTLVGYILNLDARVHELTTEIKAQRGDSLALARVRKVANEGDASAKALLALIDEGK